MQAIVLSQLSDQIPCFCTIAITHCSLARSLCQHPCFFKFRYLICCFCIEYSTVIVPTCHFISSFLILSIDNCVNLVENILINILVYLAKGTMVTQKLVCLFRHGFEFTPKRGFFFFFKNGDQA